MLLENKNAVIYGAGGSIGGAVARSFAGEGARVFLAGRTLESLEEVGGVTSSQALRSTRRQRTAVLSADGSTPCMRLTFAAEHPSLRFRE
jgi:NAD(P)-dependent dehydrogenase (short-subunit alcohol dehydrogenase family)